VTRHRVVRTALPTLLAVTALAMASCAGEPSTAPSGAAGGGSAEAPTDLTIGSSQKILSLDPDHAADGYSEGIVHLLGGNLYELGPDEQVRPLLVTSGSASADRRTWEFELKNGLQFSDGTPLTAEDVKATIERAKNDETNVYAGFVEPISGVDAPTATTVTMHLSRPYPSLPTVLSQPEMTILPKHGLAKGPSFFDAPISAGPFMLSSWGGGPTAVLVRNPHYVGEPPAVDRLTFQTIEDFNARFAQVQSGQLDFATDIPARLLENPPAGLVAALTPHYGFVTLPLNVNSAPLNDVNVRRAIGKAVDRQQINATAWGGKTTPIAGFWPSTMSGYDETISTSRDVTGAKAALQGTACQNGCRINFMYSTANPWAEPTATVVAQNLKDIGIDVALEKLDDATFNERLGGLDYQMAASFLYDYNDVPDGMLRYALTADGGLNANYSGFQPGLDVQQAVTKAITQEGAARNDALAELNRLFLEYQPFVTVSDYAVGSVSRYAPSVVKSNEAGFIDISRRGSQP
jgi:peptide/nickel transport system substrate-binding protein